MCVRIVGEFENVDKEEGKSTENISGFLGVSEHLFQDSLIKEIRLGQRNTLNAIKRRLGLGESRFQSALNERVPMGSHIVEGEAGSR